MGRRHGVQLDSVGTIPPSSYGLKGMLCVNGFMARNLSKPGVHVDERRLGIALDAADAECPGTKRLLSDAFRRRSSFSLGRMTA